MSPGGRAPLQSKKRKASGMKDKLAMPRSGSAASPMNISSAKDRASPNMGSRAATTGGSNHVGTKKLVIRPMRVAPKVATVDFDSAWSGSLLLAVRAVQTTTAVAFSYEELYQTVESLCRHKHASTLYAALSAACETHIHDQVKKLDTQGQAMENIEYLSMVCRCWNDLCSQMKTTASIFLFLDRSFVLQEGPNRSIYEMGLHLFRTQLLANPVVERKVVAGLLTVIEQERNGENIDHPLVKTLLRMFSAISRYTDSFQGPFLDATDLYYKSEGMTKMNSLDVPNYLRHVEGRLHAEANRVINFLEDETEKPLVASVEKNLITNHTENLLDKGFDAMCEETRIADLARLYKLLGRASSNAVSEDQKSANAGFESLKKALTAYTNRVGGSIVMDPEKDTEMVDRLLEFKTKLDQILDEAFQNSDKLSSALRESFEHFINRRQNVPAALIAKYIDNILRTGNKGFSEEELDDTIDRVMTLFRFIESKDVFEAFYKKYLSKRLLFQKSASHDLEKMMLGKLKSQCGAAFTNKLEGMFKDVDVSKDIMTAFGQRSGSRESDIELNVYVLTNSYWPHTTGVDVNLPREIADIQETFKTFYLGSYEGRRLSWQYSGGTCLLRANFRKGQKLLDLSLYQSIILLLFNDSEELNYKDILTATALDETELKRTLLSLASGKPQLRVIQKVPKGAQVNETDKFVFNKDFEHKLRRLKINAIQIKETKQETEQTTQKVYHERVYAIDAAIVRIMKTRKAATHTQLISELFAQLKFPHKPQDLKKRIESLIERDYLERDENNSQMYRYLA